MRILYHHRTRSEDAQGIHISEMTRAFRGLGHEVEMVSLVRRAGRARGPAERARDSGSGPPRAFRTGSTS